MLKRLKKNYLLLLSTFLIFYFFFNLLSGQRGLISYFEKKDILNQLKKEELVLISQINDLDLKNSLLWSYRLHNPRIRLKPEMKKTLESLINLGTKIVILTDGRSITQRLKIKSLGLDFLPNYISEEYSSEKPDKKRFLQIQDDFPSKYYVYIADNPTKDFIAPLEINWICIGANWIKNRIHNLNLESMPKICLDNPSEITDILLKLK